MTAHRTLSFLALLTTIASTTGCGSDDTPSPAPGTSTPATDSGVTPTPPRPTSDAGAQPDAGSTPGGGCTTGLAPITTDTVPCGNGTACGSGEVCCMSTQGACRTKASGCLGGEKELGCASSGAPRCPSGGICCMNATAPALAALKTSTTCPAPLRFGDFSVTECFAACTPARIPVCQSDAECRDGATCHAVVLTEAFAPITFGICY